MNFGKRTPAAESERIVRRALERASACSTPPTHIAMASPSAYSDVPWVAIASSVVVATKAGFGRVGGKPEGLPPEVVERALAAIAG